MPHPDHASDLFLSLTPDKVLDAVEAAGLRCNPVCQALNSFENRVYEVELEDGTRIVGKFYRPGRWTEAQILEEHAFMDDCEQAEIPICGIRRFPDGSTLKQMDHIYYCLYPRFGGRAPQDLDDDLAERLGMLVGRLHAAGAARSHAHRVTLDADTYVRANLAWLVDNGTIPPELEDRYVVAAEELADRTDALMEGVEIQRIHGDFHRGNILVRDELLHVLDFDDTVVGPPVQDLWLCIPGRDDDASRLQEAFIEGYEAFRAFPRSTLHLIEPLRGLRMVHYATWLARRWHDPVFPVTWPHFGTEDYWRDETEGLEEVLALIRAEAGETPRSPAEEEPELTNKDFFWDWED